MFTYTNIIVRTAVLQKKSLYLIYIRGRHDLIHPSFNTFIYKEQICPHSSIIQYLYI